MGASQLPDTPAVSLQRLQISRVRNLRQVELPDLEQVNVFFGPNGSGKTSVLESIHFLGLARSFRGQSVKSLITHGEPDCVVFGLVRFPSRGSTLSLGVQRAASGESFIRVGGDAVRSVAELATHLPLQLINADSFDLLTGAPASRRRYLDWGVFHVEHAFLDHWQRFQRCIKQRNMLLRHGKISDQELAVWTRDLAASGDAIGTYRRDYFTQLVPRFTELVSRLAPSLSGLELRYQQGWDRQTEYGEALEANRQTDIEQGYTHVGPQRADLKVVIQGRLASETLSRGQQKLVVCALKLAQGQLMAEQKRGQCIYLVDDLPSELDAAHSRKVCEVLAELGSQVFITCVERDDISSVWPAGDRQKIRMFHVEQGAAHPVASDSQ